MRTTPYPLLTESARADIAQRAHALDTQAELASTVLPMLAHHDLLRMGLPAAQGGHGGDVRDAMAAIIEVASLSLTTAFVFWSQRAFIHYLQASGNEAARERWWDALLRGDIAGAVGLSNVIKFLSRIEALQVQARPVAQGWCLDGVLPWVSNVRTQGFVVAAAVQPEGGGLPMVMALESGLPGLVRSPDLDLLGMRASNTAALQLNQVTVHAQALLAQAGPPYLKAARPGFLGMQCALSIGLARAALQAAAQDGGARGPLHSRVTEAQATLGQVEAELLGGVLGDRWVADVSPLFALRMRLAGLVQQALQLELQATGGRAYLQDRQPDFGRRWRESAFIPIVTPSLTQLEGELAQHAPQVAV